MIKLVSTVGFIITNEKNEILLIKITTDEKEEVKEDRLILPKKEDEIVEDEWTIPFGTVEEDENPRDIIKKELKKLLSCDVGSCDYFNLYFYNISDSFIKKACYFYGTVAGEIKTKNPLVTAVWVSLDKAELDKLNLIAEQREALNDFINFFQDKFLEKMD
jgi:hypothetical protein